MHRFSCRCIMQAGPRPVWPERRKVVHDVAYRSMHVMHASRFTKRLARKRASERQSIGTVDQRLCGINEPGGMQNRNGPASNVLLPVPVVLPVRLPLCRPEKTTLRPPLSTRWNPRASVVGLSLIILPDQEKWSGDGAGIKAITGGDAVAIVPKYRDAYSTHIPAVILAVNNNPMRFSDRSGGVSRRRVILTFPQVIPAKERDPQLLEKISTELAIIVRHQMQRFSKPDDARELL